jgi:hypothetical protein
MRTRENGCESLASSEALLEAAFGGRSLSHAFGVTLLEALWADQF